MRIKIARERLFYTIFGLRCILAFIAAAAVFFNRKNISIVLFIFTALVGFFDSLAARKHDSQLRLIIDFLADKLLVNLVAITLAINGIIPWWVSLIVLARDLLTIIGGAILIYKDVRREFKQTVIGKISYFSQVMALMQVMISQQVDWYLMSAALTLTIASGAYTFVKSEFRLARKKTDLEQFRMVKLLKLADAFTLVGAALGLVSIAFSINDSFRYAAIAMLAAVVFDYLDGKIAVTLHQQNPFGRELDSLADTVAFGVAPAIFGFSLIQYSSNLKQFQVTFGMIAFTVFLFCGILRLARYNIMDIKGAYAGMPITLNGIFIPFIYFIGTPAKFYPYIYLVLGVLMVSSLRVKKLL